MVSWTDRGRVDPGVENPLSLELQGLAADELMSAARSVSEAVARKTALTRRVRRGVLLERFANPCNLPAGSSKGGGRFGEKDDPECAGAGAGAALRQIKNAGIEDVGGVPVEQWLTNHGIGAEEFVTRGYHKWEQTGEDGLDPAIKAAFGSDKAAITQMRNAAGQTSGVIMPRHVVPGSPEGEILPQTRPDSPVISATEISNLRRQKITMEDLEDDPNLRDRVVNGFVADSDIIVDGKVRYKKGDEVPGIGAKYLFPAGEGNAARIDLPPGVDQMNRERFLSGEGRVYLAMEGSLKTDAVITSIRLEGEQEGASVIGVPSVTLWNTPELDWVASNHLQGREVVLIPDADGVTNPLVRNQARALQTRLESLGTGKVIVASPPLGAGDSVQKVSLPGGGTEKLKGVDDFLGAGGGRLDGLSFVDRVTPRVDLTFEDHGLTTQRSVDNLQNTLRSVAAVAGPSGVVRMGLRSIGAATGTGKDTAQRMVERLERLGLVKVEHLFDMTESRQQELVNSGVLPRKRGKNGGWVLNTTPEKITIHGDEFVLRDELKSPVYTIVNPEHRAVDSPPAFLADLSGRGERIVRTPEGSERFGLPIGAPIPEGGVE